MLIKDIFEKRNKNHSYLQLLFEFVYPNIPTMQDNYTIYYPSRVMVAIFLSLSGVIGCNQILVYYYIWTGEQLQKLQTYIDAFEDVNFKRVDFEHISAAKDFSVSMMKTIYFFGKPISDALLVGSMFGLAFGIFGSFVLCRSWKQRVVHMRYSYFFNGKKFTDSDMRDYPLCWSAKFISTIACNIVFGSALMALFIALIFGVLSSIDIWESFIDSGIWKYVLGYLLYYVFEWIIFQYLIMKVWFKHGINEHKCASLILIINDLTYIPLAALFCVIKIIQSAILCIVSFMRPDLSVFPSYLSTLDHGHLVFVANARLAVQSEKNYYSLQTIIEETNEDSNDDI